MATVEQMDKARRDLRRIDAAAERLKALYVAKLEIRLEDHRAAPTDFEALRHGRAIEALRRYVRDLESCQDMARNRLEWIAEDLGE
jgi:hypothetical protein